MEPDAIAEPAASYRTPAAALDGWGTFRMEQEALERKRRIVGESLNRAGIPYAMIGGQAVAHYVGQVDPAAVRTTPNIDLLMNEEDLPAAEEALRPHGFKYRHAAGVHTFLDTTSARNGVHVVIADRKVRPEYPEPAPGLESVSRTGEDIAVIPFEKLVAMKLTSFRDIDRTHLDDMLDVGLLPGAVMEALPPALRERLRYLLDNPE